MPEFQELLVDEMRDLYDAEKQLTKALPKMAKAASHEELRQAFQDHLEMTQNQIARLEQAFEMLGEKAKSKPCKAMKGLVEEGQEHIQEHGKGPMLDAALIGAAQKVEHYEISGYGTARALAKALGQKDVASLLDETAKEEGATDKLLTQISVRMMKEVMSASPEDVDEEMPMKGARGGNGRSAMASGGRGAAKKKVGSRGNGAGRSSRGGRQRSGGGSASQYMTDHEQIREWAEERGAKPACVRGTGNKGGIGMIRLDFPGYTGADKLQEISWDEWFDSFDENNLALVYQDETAGGQKSNFNKLVSRENVEQGGSARRR